MAILLFKLRHVPDDEAEEVRGLLEENNIAFYETSAGNWRVSMPALWLKDESQLALAQKLLSDYQQQRYQLARENYEILKSRGENKSMWDNFSENPAKVTLYLGLLTLVLYVSLQLFRSLQ